MSQNLLDPQPGDDRLQHLAQVTANALAKEYNSRYKSKIPIPVPLSFTLEYIEPKYAGLACSVIDGAGIAQEIKLNMTLYRDNVREFLNEVIPHEVAHLKQRWDDHKNFTTSTAHGYVWQIAMRQMSKLPVAKHKMDVSKAGAVYKAHKEKLRKEKALAKKQKS